MRTMRTTWVLAAVTAAALLGCGREEIRVYTIPKEQPAAEAPAPVARPAAPRAAPITWTLPAGWQQFAGKGMRYATLLAGPDDTAPQVTVTALAPMAGNVLNNVNRWRGELGLAAIGAEQLDTVVTTVPAGGGEAHVVDLAGEATGEKQALRMLAAIVPRPRRVWFFKLVAPPEEVGQHEADFQQLIRSLQFGGAPAAAQQAAPADAAGADPHAGIDMSAARAQDESSPGAPGPDPLGFDTPAQWQRLADPGQMRLAAFTITDGDDQATMAITRFPGNVGGKLANVQRWRRQVGLGAISDMTDQPVTAVQVDGIAGELYELTSDRFAMLVVSVPQGGYTWFFKLTGPAELLARQKPVFEAFVGSVAFGGDGGE